MAILKSAGQAFGMKAQIRFTGPTRRVAIVLILAPAQSVGHADPLGVPVERWFWVEATLPEAPVERVLEFNLQWASFPSLPDGNYDVHRFIADPPRQAGETNTQVYNRARAKGSGTNDWDDDVFTVAAAAPPPIPDVFANWAAETGGYF